MVDVATQIIIDRPQKEVFDYTVNPDNAPKWYINIKSVEWKTTKPLRIGSKVAFLAMFLGRTLSYVYEMIELIKYEKLVMCTDYGPFLMETTYLFEALDDKKTKVSLRNRGNPNGFSKFLTPFMSLAMKRANRKDLQRLKQVLELPSN